jgi:hypothetical protein
MRSFFSSEFNPCTFSIIFNTNQEIEELQQALEEVAAARDEAERKAEAALVNAVTAKEMAYQAREEMRAVQLESAQREEHLKAWVEDRVRRPSLADRVRRMLRGDRRWYGRPFWLQPDYVKCRVTEQLPLANVTAQNPFRLMAGDLRYIPFFGPGPGG